MTDISKKSNLVPGRSYIWTESVSQQARIAELEAQQGISGFVCDGCGYLCRDQEKDLEQIRKAGGISCCPERKMVPFGVQHVAVVKPLVWRDIPDSGFVCLTDPDYSIDYWPLERLYVDAYTKMMRDGRASVVKDKLQAQHERRILSATTLKAEAEVRADERAKVLGEIDGFKYGPDNIWWEMFNTCGARSQHRADIIAALHTPESRAIAEGG